MLVNTEAAEAFQAPGTLVVNEAVEKFTALDHGSFQGLLSSWQIIYVIFVVVRLRGHRIDITHKRAPESECLVRSDQKAQEVRNNGRYTTHKRQNFIQRQQEPNTVHLLSGLNDRCFEQFLFIAAFILACWVVPCRVVRLVSEQLCAKIQHFDPRQVKDWKVVVADSVLVQVQDLMRLLLIL